MPDEQTPNAGGGVTAGIFDHIKGARSTGHPDDVDIPAEEAPAQAQDTGEETPPEPAAPASVEESGEDPAQLRAKNEELERQMAELGPYAQFGMAIYGDPRGKQMAQRWQQGQQVFDGSTKGQALTSEALQAELDRREAARTQMDELNTLVTERHPDFHKIRRGRTYAKHLEGELVKTWREGSTTEDLHKDARGWADKVLAKNFTAMMSAFELCLRDNPKVVEAAKEAGKLESKERAEAALAGEVSSSSGTSKSTGETPPKSDEDQMIERLMGAKGVGRSFATVGRGTK